MVGFYLFHTVISPRCLAMCVLHLINASAVIVSISSEEVRALGAEMEKFLGDLTVGAL